MIKLKKCIDKRERRLSRFKRYISINFDLSLGERIRNCRKELNYTQDKLASQVGVTKKTISFYENNQRMPPLDMLLKLAEIFSVSTDYLLEKTDFKNEAANDFSPRLSSQEKIFLELFQLLDNDYKDIVLGDLKKYIKMQATEHNSNNSYNQSKKRA